MKTSKSKIVPTILCSVVLIVIIVCLSLFSGWYLMRHFSAQNRLENVRRNQILANFKPSKHHPVPARITNSTATKLDPIKISNQTLPQKPRKPEIQSLSNVSKRNLIKQLTEKLWNQCNGNFKFDSMSEFWFVKPSYRFTLTSMSTLWLMDLREQFNQSQRLIENQIVNQNNQKIDNKKLINFSSKSKFSSEIIGSLLVCYALTRDQLFADKILDLLFVLEEPGFEADYFSMLEYSYLSHITKNNEMFKDKIDKNMRILENQSISELTKKNPIELASYLVKLYSFSSRTNNRSIELYKQLIDQLEIEEKFVKMGMKIYFKDSENYMSGSSCLLGAILSLGGELMLQTLQKSKKLISEKSIPEMNRINRHWELAEGIVEGCADASLENNGFLPEKIFLGENLEQNSYNKIKFSPELAESYFTLWRLTHKQKYRNYAWKMVESIQEKYYKNMLDNGESFQKGNGMIMSICTEQEIEVVSSVLKFLYLIFVDEGDSASPLLTMPLDRWVFNQAGQPLPIFRDSSVEEY